MTTDFVLHDELLRLQEEDIANYPIPNEVQIQGKTDAELSQYLNGNLEPFLHLDTLDC